MAANSAETGLVERIIDALADDPCYLVILGVLIISATIISKSYRHIEKLEQTRLGYVNDAKPKPTE